MQRKYRLLVIGPKNRHIENFVDRVFNDCSEIGVVTQADMDFPASVKVWKTDFAYRKLGNFLKTPRFITKVIEEFKPDLVHIHQIDSGAYFAMKALKKKGIPVVITAWGSDVLLNPDKGGFLRKNVVNCLRQADAFTSDSTFMADKMRSLVQEKNLDIRICNFGVPESDIPVQKGKFIYSNRMHNPLYRIDKIIKAFAELKKTEVGKDWKLILAGRGSETENLLQQISDLNIEKDVDHVGFISNEENFKLYAKSSVFVSVPESDATAMSLLEAMYYGCY